MNIDKAVDKLISLAVRFWQVAVFVVILCVSGTMSYNDELAEEKYNGSMAEHERN